MKWLISMGALIIGSASAEDINVTLPNLALNANALASQSSVCNGGKPIFAIDDDKATFVETCDESDPWWMVNLDGLDSSFQKNYYVARVTIDPVEPIDAQVQLLDASMNVVASQLLSAGAEFASMEVAFDNALGRYVRVWSSKPGSLMLSQVRVYGMEDPANPSNIAMSPSALATQSSTCSYESYPVGVASFAIDGDTEGVKGKYSYTCDGETELEWWMLDLDSVTMMDQSIDKIIIHHPTEETVEALSNCHLEVLDGNMTTIYSQAIPIVSNDATFKFEFGTPLVGRFVRIRKSQAGNLAIAEVIVIGAPTQWNVARIPYAIASQSSTCAFGNDSDGVASRAIDGDTSGSLGKYTYTCSISGEYSWWMVNLDAVTNSEQSISQITVYNRRDRYLSSLSYSYVQIMDTNMNNVFMQKLPAGSSDASWTFHFDIPVLGRFVRVLAYSFQSLGIAEVEVIGVPASKESRGLLKKFPNAVATQSSTCSASEFDTPGIANRAIDGIVEGFLPHYTFSCVAVGEYQWWMVDLDSVTHVEHTIGEIIVYNRQDKSRKALSSSYVEVLDSDMNTVFSQKLPIGSNAPSWTIALDPPVAGRFVRIRKYTDDILAITEVDVIPTDTTTRTATTAATSTTTTITTTTTTTAAATTTTTTTSITTRPPMCPPPFDRPEGLQPEAQATLAAALDTLYQHMVAGPSNPILNQTEIILATNDVIANSHQLTASYELMAAALSLVEAYEGFDGSGPPTSYGPPVLKSQQFSRVQGTLDDREVDRTMMMIQQAILDQMFHASLWGIDGVPTEKTSEMMDWAYKPVVKECQDLFRGRKFWAAKYIPGLVDPPADPTIVHAEVVKADFRRHWGRPAGFSDTRRAIYPIGGLYLAPGGVASITVPQEIVDHGNYYIQIGSHSVDCSKETKGYTRQNRMTTAFPIDEVTTYVANPFGGELYIRPPYGSAIEAAEIKVTGDVVQGATFFYSSFRNTTEEEWNHLRENAPAPWVHIVTNSYLRQWHAKTVKSQTYSFMIERAKRYTDTYNSVSKIMGIPPEKRNTWVLYQAFSSNACSRLSVGSMGYPMNNDAVTRDENGIIVSRYDFSEFDPVRGRPPCCGTPTTTHAHDPQGQNVNMFQQLDFHELGHSASWGCSGLYNGGEKESINHMVLMAARWALEKENDSSLVDPTGVDTAFMLSCCSLQNPYTYAPRFTIDRQAIEWMTRDNFLNRSPMHSDEVKYQHRGHAKYADIARLTGSLSYLEEFMLEEHERWETEARKANSTNNGGLGTGSCYWWRNFDDSFFTEFDDKSSESRTLRLSIKAGQDLTPILHFWGVHHSDYPLLKEMHVARGLFPSKEQKDLLLKYKSLIPQESSKLQAIHYDVWVPNITKKCYSGCDEFLQRTLSWNQTMAVQAQSHVDAIIDMFWPSSGRRLGMQASSKQNYLRISSPPHIHPFNPVISRNLQVDDEFEININKWMSYGPAAKYTFTFERECLCTDGEHGPFKVTVQNGIVTDAKYALDELEASIYTEVDLNDMPTIEGLFNFTAESMKEPKNIVRVKYNNETGYPIEISVIRDDDYEEEERFENDMDEGDIDWIIIYVSYVTFGMKDEA